jgi:hypothetical protein
VQMISTTRGLSAVSGPGAAGAARAANGGQADHADVPSVFRRAQNS